MAAKGFDDLPTRKTRIVCISDTHNSSPKDGGWKLPKGDVLIHAGDLTNQGTISELQKTIGWIENADFEAKIIIAGNHDITLDQQFYTQNWQSFHNQNAQDHAKCKALLIDSPSITYLNHSSATIRLTSERGPQTHFTIFGSPHVPSRGLWAFGYDSEAEARELWANIPQETNILVTHTPPQGYCDSSPKWGHHAGCGELSRAIGMTRPSLAVCGHVHESWGAMRVIWNGISSEVAQKESIALGDSATSKKQCLIDLTGKTRAKQHIDGSHDEMHAQSHATPNVSTEASSSSTNVTSTNHNLVTSDQSTLAHQLDIMSVTTQEDADSLFARHADSRNNAQNPALGVGPWADRKETCIVNAAILATSYGAKPKRFNKPIVVDIDLPVCK